MRRDILRGDMNGPEKVRLVGPGGAGKSTIGALLAERLEIPFVDLDGYFASRFGDISHYIGRYGYDVYARETSRRIARCLAERSTLKSSRCLPVS